MSFPRYPAYKDSGVEWLPSVPAHWEVPRLRTVAKLNPSKNQIRDLSPDTSVTFLPMEAIGEDGSIDISQERPLATVLDGYTFLCNGDVAFAKITPCFENGKGAVMRGLRNGIAFGTTELTVLRPDLDKLLPDFLHYTFASRLFRQMGESHMYGAGGQKRVPDSFARDCALPTPPIDEQRKLVTFLDRETAKIDALIAEQERLIALLQEKRQAVISHAVTKGLDPNVPMKESGVIGISEVPSHWTIVKMKWVATMHSGHTPDKKVPEYWKGGTIPWISLNDTQRLQEKETIEETANCITEAGIAGSSARLLPAGVVVFSRDATIGRCAITLRPMAVSQHFIAWECRGAILERYLLFRLRSMTQELDRLATGATVLTIGMPEIRTLLTPLPPLSEQATIVKHIDLATATTDSNLSASTEMLNLLRERRSALITAAVTGQIDVRGLVDTAA